VDTFRASGIARDQQAQHCHTHTAHAWRTRLFSSHGSLVNRLRTCLPYRALTSDIACQLQQDHGYTRNLRDHACAPSAWRSLLRWGCHNSQTSDSGSAPRHELRGKADHLPLRAAFRRTRSGPARPTFFSSENTPPCVRNGILRTRCSVDAGSSTEISVSRRVAMLPAARWRAYRSDRDETASTGVFQKCGFESCARDHPRSAESTSNLGPTP
jgi:hypothetical protein